MDRGWIGSLLGADPVPWLLTSDEPFAVWATLTGVLGRHGSDLEVVSARRASLGDPSVRSLAEDLPGWGVVDPSGHHSPKFLPNRLNLLADMGVRGGDDERVETILDELLAHQDRDGRFLSWGSYPGRPKPEWGSLSCDTNAITDVLLRFDRGGDERVARALHRVAEDLHETPQGQGWRCIPEKRSLFRGPGRKADVCPQVTLEGLRAFSQVPEEIRPKAVRAAARTPLETWRRRTEERPYQFGHGYQFKTVKWPSFWYDVLWVLETVGRFPELWRGERARPQDRASVAELAACLIAYDFSEDGRVTPRRIYRGFERYSFGQKTRPSPFATARCLIALARVSDLAEEIAAVDVEALPSSKGGSGTAVPPPRRWPLASRPVEPPPCPVPRAAAPVSHADAVARVLARHHIGTPWTAASPETIVADVVGLHGADPLSPYLSLQARLPGFSSAQLDSALTDRRSLVRFRCMRGTVYVVRREMLPVVFAATNEQVVRYARNFAKTRGVRRDDYERVAEDVMHVLDDEALSVRGIRARLQGSGRRPPEWFDLAAAVTLMTAEGRLLQERPPGGRGHEPRYRPLAAALPGVRLDSVRRPDADVRLVREYVRAFGPVTPRDVVWWTGIGRKRTKHALERLGDEIVEVELTGSEEESSSAGRDAALDGVWLAHASDIEEFGALAPTDAPQVALLPANDPLLAGYCRKGRFISEEDRPRTFDRTGNATSTVLVDGRVEGVWDAPRDEPVVLLHLFREPSEAVRLRIEERARETGMFLFGEGVRLEPVAEMPPLSRRRAGAFRKPLR